MRPKVPYPIVAANKMAQIPVIIPPMGKIRMWRPGKTNGAPDATTRVWIGGETWLFVGTTWVAKTPETKVASWEERLVLTVWPVALTAVKLTVGTRTFWRSALRMLA
jgi:hypothetical protein